MEKFSSQWMFYRWDMRQVSEDIRALAGENHVMGREDLRRVLIASLKAIGDEIPQMNLVLNTKPMNTVRGELYAEVVKYFSWRPTYVGLGVVGILLGIVIWIAVRNDPSSMKKPHQKVKKSILSGIVKVSKNSQTWINGLVAMMFYTATAAFGGLWAIPFLKQTQGFSNEEASFAASMIYVGWIVAGPILGHISDRRCNRKMLLYTCTLLSILFFALVVYSPIQNPIALFTLMFLLGCTLSAQLLCYSLAIELNAPETKGFALAMTNFLTFVASSIIQTLVGVLLQINWTGKMEGGAPVYGLPNYKVALIAFPITMAIAFIFIFFIKEKKKPWCKA